MASSPDDSSILPLSDGTPHSKPKEQQQQPHQSSPMKDNNESFLIQVSETLPSHDTIQKFLSSPSCGAISTFVGITR
ncbi:hypothetical protein ACHAXR_000174, partial [Thalassiosira sp. AJA248-18]